MCPPHPSHSPRDCGGSGLRRVSARLSARVTRSWVRGAIPAKRLVPDLLRLAFVIVLLLGSGSADGAVLRRGIQYEPASLDPHKYNAHDEAAIILDLFEGL